MIRINKLFQEKKNNILSIYFTAGYPSLNDTIEIIKTLDESNVDLIEIGMPFSDPIADGPIIQYSSNVAIDNGMNLHVLFKQLANIRKITNIPIILMGYYNMILQYGENTFLNDCKRNKVDGLIVVDLPWPENKNFAKKCKQRSICYVQLLSPTTSQKRLKLIVKDSHEMIYYISMLSTTGGKLKVSPSKILTNYQKIKKISRYKNCVIGFGITKTTISKLRSADGLVVGSAICKEITRSLQKRQNPVTKVENMVKKLKSKII